MNFNLDKNTICKNITKYSVNTSKMLIPKIPKFIVTGTDISKKAIAPMNVEKKVKISLFIERNNWIPKKLEIETGRIKKERILMIIAADVKLSPKIKKTN